MYLVTGGAGFIGSNIVAALQERGARVVVCDRLRDGIKWRNLAKRELADFVMPEELFDWLAANGHALDAIFHMGAISATTERDADKIMHNNFKLSLALWDWCTREGKRLIYASSAATYGDGGEGFDDDWSIDHLARLRPMNAYGWSKHLFDRAIVRRIADGAPCPPQWAGLKFFNVYGPNEAHKGGMASVISHIFPRARADEAATLFKSHHPDYPDGGQMRDFVWVGDCVAMMTWLLDSPGVSGIFNCGTGKARTFYDLAAAVYAALDKEPHINFVPTPVEIRDKYQYFTEARMDRIRAAGFDTPFTELEDGVARYVRDYLAQEDSFR